MPNDAQLLDRLRDLARAAGADPGDQRLRELLPGLLAQLRRPDPAVNLVGDLGETEPAFSLRLPRA